MVNYYEIVFEDNNSNNMIYSQKIKWLPDAFTDEDCKDGFIIQRVHVDNTTGISIGFDKDYYEAWEVKTSKVIRRDNLQWDDDFHGYPVYMCKTAEEDSDGISGDIQYKCVIYWVSALNELYSEVYKWEYGRVLEAGSELRSAYVDEVLFSLDEFVVQKDRRFVHTISRAT